MPQNKLSHIAFILDGNKRWAKLNNLLTKEGYKKGFNNIENIIEYSTSINLSFLTLFTLSSENFNRTSVNIIYEIIYSNFSELIERLINRKKIKINIIGSRDKLPKKILDIFNEAEQINRTNYSMAINLAFNYGFKDEIRTVLEKFKNSSNNYNINDNKSLKKLFLLGDIPDPDILIRTGGYKRLSNFIMFNLTYTELFFTKTLWPDFTTQELEIIINKYSKIKRKYGL